MRASSGRLESPVVRLRYVKLRPDAIVPARAHDGDAGYDLHAIESVTLAPGARARVPTGIAVAIPDGHAGFVLPRSGLADRHGIALANAPGLIDSGYRGEIQVLLLNTDRRHEFQVRVGDRIGQLVVVAFASPDWTEVSDLDDTVRGAAGFGSSGV